MNSVKMAPKFLIIKPIMDVGTAFQHMGLSVAMVNAKRLVEIV